MYDNEEGQPPLGEEGPNNNAADDQEFYQGSHEEPRPEENLFEESALEDPIDTTPPFSKTPIEDELPQDSLEETPLEQTTLNEVSLKVHLEVARMHVSLEELQKMQPGYRLPIDINPRIVNLTINGKMIGQGEIVELGDTVGVKILKLNG